MKKFWQNFTLKMSLFRIWLLKNIILFIETAFIVLIVLILTGVITEQTPVLGKIPLIGGEDGLISSIHKILDGTEDVSSVFGVILSIFLTVGMFMLKVKNISQADIKSDKTKLALINANLYFNKDGRLVKKVEKATSRDINNDGKIDEEERREPHRGFLSRAVSATKELVLILSTDFSDNETENKEKYKEVLAKGELEDAAEADSELRKEIIPDIINDIEDSKIDSEEKKIDEQIDERVDISDTEKENKKAGLKAFFGWFKPKKRQVKKDVQNKIQYRIDHKEEIKAEKLKKKALKEALKEEKRAKKLAKKQAKEEAKKAKEAAKNNKVEEEKDSNIETPVSTPVTPEAPKPSTEVTNKAAVNNFISSIKKH